MRLAPIGVVAEKLRARSPEVRIAALAHVRGHGKDARALAAHVASMLAEEERVAWAATLAFDSVAAGAADAVPVLVRHLEQTPAEDRLVVRALEGLQRVGPEAWPALPVLEKLYDGPHRRLVLHAMAAIAPNAPSIAPRVVAMLFSDEDRDRIAAETLLARGDGPVDAALAQLRLNAFSFARKKRQAAHRALRALAAVRPVQVAQLVVELSRGAKPPLDCLLTAIRALPSPLRPELASLAVRCVLSDDLDVAHWAAQAVDAHDLAAPMEDVVRRHLSCGPDEPAGRVFAVAARRSNDSVRPLVDAWLRRVARLELRTDKRPSWPVVAEVLRASPTPENVIAVAQAAERFGKTHRTSLVELHRRLRQLTTPDVLDRAGVPLEDPYPDEPELPPADADYPDFPTHDEPPPPGRLEEVSEAPPLLEDLGRGLSLLGRAPTAAPADLAQSLQTFLERQQGQSLDDAAVQGLAAVWAHALTTQLNWSWARWVRADERALALASPQRTHMVFPAAWVRRQLRKKEPTALLQFNMLAEGKAPPPGDEPAALW